MTKKYATPSQHGPRKVVIVAYEGAKVRTNFYSVPLKPGSIVEARLYPSVVEFRQEDVRIAQHQRSYDRCQQILDLEHYLDVLEHKPGALREGKPRAHKSAASGVG